MFGILLFATFNKLQFIFINTLYKGDLKRLDKRDFPKLY